MRGGGTPLCVRRREQREGVAEAQHRGREQPVRTGCIALHHTDIIQRTTAVPIMATISRWFVKRRGLMSGLVQSGAGIGGFIISPMSGWLISAHGWRTTYGVLGVISLIGMVVSGLFLRRDPRDVGLLPDGAEAECAAGGNRPGGRPSAPAPSRSRRPGRG